MRVMPSLGAVVLWLAACGQGQSSSPPAVSPTLPTQYGHVSPANIERVRKELPAGYEVAGIGGRVSPLALWGFGGEATADPSQCGALAELNVDPATARGWSASGVGGIVYAVVGEFRDGALDPALLDQCGRWTLASGHTRGTVTAAVGPAVDGAATVSMTAAMTTSVEGGTATASNAQTCSAYLPGYVAFVTVVTDPGAPNPPLDPDFAAQLLVKTVSALRG